MRGRRPGAVEGIKVQPQSPFRGCPAAQPSCPLQRVDTGAARLGRDRRSAPAHLLSHRRVEPGPPARSASPGLPGARSARRGACCLGYRRCPPPAAGATAAERGPGGFACLSAAPERAEKGKQVGVRFPSEEGPLGAWRPGTWPQGKKEGRECGNAEGKGQQGRGRS